MVSRIEKIESVLNIVFLIFLILFSLVIIYQLILKIFEGSWTETFMLMSLGIGIITILFIIVGFLVGLSRSVGRLEGGFGNFKDSFVRLVSDFRELRDDFKEHVSKKKALTQII